MRQSISNHAGTRVTLSLCFVTVIAISILLLSWKQWAPNPLAQTKWSGTMAIPSEEEVVLEFTNDHFNLIYEQQVVEASTYQVKGDTITLTKVSGNSPCQAETGNYLYRIGQDKLTFKLLHDDCPARSQAFSPIGYKRLTN